MDERLLLIHETPAVMRPDRWLQMVSAAIRRARLCCDSVSAVQASQQSLDSYSTVLLCVGYDSQLSSCSAKRIRAHVEAGGGLVVLRPVWDAVLAPVMGFHDEQARPDLVRQNEILIFLDDFLPGLKNTEIELVGHHMSAHPQNVTPIARSDRGREMAWFNRYGKGRVICFNSAMGSKYWAPGLIVESVLRSQSVSIRPVANVGVVQIDDFPAPVSTKRLDPVAADHDLAMIEFYDRLWLPDMLELAANFRLPYTFLISFNYDATTRGPFDFPEWRRVKLGGDATPYGVRAAQKISADHELGLHGYNHQPFTLQHWKNEDQMRRSLRAVRTRWQADELGSLPRTYVPPGNEYDSGTVRALAAEFPSITTLSAYLNEHPIHGVDHDFGAEPRQPSLFSLPRNTAGYFRDQSMTLNMLSLLGSMGVWSHMLHPDDIVDNPANNPDQEFSFRNPDSRGWLKDPQTGVPGMLDELRNWFEFARRHYPWLRYLRSSDATPELAAHINSRLSVSRGKQGLRVSSTAPGYYELVVAEERTRAFVPPNEVELVSTRRVGGVYRYVLHSTTQTFTLSV